jgi:hypothetical protein
VATRQKHNLIHTVWRISPFFYDEHAPSRRASEYPAGDRIESEVRQRRVKRTRRVVQLADLAEPQSEIEANLLGNRDCRDWRGWHNFSAPRQNTRH